MTASSAHPDLGQAPAGAIGIGVIGVGGIATSVHLPLLARDSAFQVIAVADLNTARAQQIGQRYGAVALPTELLLADPAIDAVIIATPGNHAELAITALAAGKHVLAEKPLALSRADALAAARCAEQHDRVLQVGYMKSHDHALALLQRGSAQIGELRSVQLEVRHPSDAPQLAHLTPGPAHPLPPKAAELATAADARDWERVEVAVGAVPEAWRRLYRYVLHGSLVHQVALLRTLSLLPEPRFDLADVRAWDGGTPPALTVSAPLPDGARMILNWAWLADYPEYRESLTLVGTRGSVQLDLAPPYRLDTPSRIEVVAAGDHPSAQQHLLSATSPFQAQLQDFAAAVRNGQRPDDAAGAAADTAWLQALFTALTERAGISVGGEAAGTAALHSER